MKNLNSKIVPIEELNAQSIQLMFEIYKKYYAGTSIDVFLKDLHSKNWSILLYDETEQLQGFSTLELFTTKHHEQTINVLFSGDTIVQHDFWGQQELAQAWLRFAGMIKNKEPNTPLYWFLIVKGYRTYRYLSVFPVTYYPAPNYPVPPEVQSLIDNLAKQRFGDAYDAQKGIIHFAEEHGHLRGNWADIPERVKKRKEVEFFLKRNPHYYKGDELVCLCELSKENLKPYSQRFFMSGFAREN